MNILMSNIKAQISNQIQNPNDKKFDIKSFDIHLTFGFGNLKLIVFYLLNSLF